MARPEHQGLDFDVDYFEDSPFYNEPEEVPEEPPVRISELCTDHRVALLLQREIGVQDRRSIHSRFGYRNYRQFYPSIKMDECRLLDYTCFSRRIQWNQTITLYGWSHNGRWFSLFNESMKTVSVYEYKGVTDVVTQQLGTTVRDTVKIKPFLRKRCEILIKGRLRTEVVKNLPNSYKYSDDSRFLITTFMITNPSADTTYHLSRYLQVWIKIYKNTEDPDAKPGAREHELRDMLAEAESHHVTESICGRNKNDYLIFLVFDLLQTKITSQLVLTDVDIVFSKTVFIRNRTLTAIRQTGQHVDMYEINDIGRWEKKKRIGSVRDTTCIHEPDADTDVPDHWAEIYQHDVLISNLSQKVMAACYREFKDDIQFLKRMLRSKTKFMATQCIQITNDVIALTLSNNDSYERMDIYGYLNWKTESVIHVMKKIDFNTIKTIEKLFDFYVPPTWSRLNESPITINHNKEHRKIYDTFIREAERNHGSADRLFRTIYNNIISSNAMARSLASPYLDANLFDTPCPENYEIMYPLPPFAFALSTFRAADVDFCRFAFPTKFISKRTRNHVFSFESNYFVKDRVKKSSMVFHPTDPVAIFYNKQRFYIIRPSVDREL